MQIKITFLLKIIKYLLVSFFFTTFAPKSTEHYER